MPIYLEIAVNVPQVSGVFHYHLPPELHEQVQVGSLVLVPFGRQTVQGVILNFIDQPDIQETRPVLDLVDPQAVLTNDQIALAHHLAHESLAPLAACIGLMLPPGLDQQADLLYTPQGFVPGDLTTTQQRLMSLLRKRGPLRGQQIDRAMPRINWRTSARSLIHRGFLSTTPVLPTPKVRPKLVRTARLACSPQDAENAMDDLGKANSKALERRQIMLRYLIREPGWVNVSWLYAESGGNISDLRALQQRDLILLGESEVLRDPLEQYEFQLDQPPTLTKDQAAVWAELEGCIERLVAGRGPEPVLLHGVTGSGKTEIYLRAVQKTLALGRQAIVLVPEIALTPQTVRRFVGRFPDQVGLIHSGLSMGERYDTWRRARAGEFNVVVGPRSALFTPFDMLGLIVVDECHDDSYYQSEAAPNYHALSAAAAYARLVGALCLFGSATPNVSTFYQCQQGNWDYQHLPSRILAHREAVKEQLVRLSARERLPEQPRSRFRPYDQEAEVIELPPVHVVDMRQELQSGNRSIFSRQLHAALEQVLEQGQQAILFLNRRGTATYVFCRDCGHTMRCPSCELPLTYHENQAVLKCHYCGYDRRMPKTCPQCGSERIRHFGTGTQRVEADVQALFPEVRTLRWDYETTRKKGAHEAILSQFVAHQADVLIGTQMLAKGLDLPLVTLVGVVLADVGLSLPDFRTNERGFQVLAQVAGRAGRSPLGGQVILQTFQPEHYVIQAAANHDYQAFYQQEIAYRKQLGYPPFVNLVRLEYRHYDLEKAEQAAFELGAQVKEWIAQDGYQSTTMVGPVPCYFSRLGGLFRWQIILKGSAPVSLLRGRNLKDWKIEVNPPSLL